ncbi:MAG: VOC family protein [Rubrivivax sp.]|nr:VOC family protein [Rubrivivax sp.]
MKPTPAGWPRISPGVYYRDATRMIDWLCSAFGFTVQIKVEGEGGRIEHSELIYGDGLIMVGEELAGAARRFETDRLSPLNARCNTQNLMVYVDDVDAHCAVARAAGARIVAEPELHDYGDTYWADRSYGAVDPEGHLWWFSQRVRG